MNVWATAALGALRRGEPCALVSILAVEGSTPREAGTRMAVTAATCAGTIGGGNLEFQAIAQARAALDHPAGTWRIQDYPLGVLLGQCCGGRVRLLVEHLDAAQVGWLAAAEALPLFTLETRLLPGRLERRLRDDVAPRLSARGPLPSEGNALVETVGEPLTPLLMAGAGHVGTALAKIMQGLPYRVDWYDTRSDSQGAIVVDPAKLAHMVRATNGPVLILTHDHALDYDLTRAALDGEAGFIGVIGSATKRARFVSRLRKDGYGEDAVVRLVCPIGLPGIAGKAPQVIAVAVAAQLLSMRA